MANSPCQLKALMTHIDGIYGGHKRIASTKNQAICSDSSAIMLSDDHFRASHRTSPVRYVPRARSLRITISAPLRAKCTSDIRLRITTNPRPWLSLVTR